MIVNKTKSQDEVLTYSCFSTVPASPLEISVSENGQSLAGDEHEIICNATTIQGVQSFPNLQWLNNSNGEILQSFVHDDIDVGPIRTQGKSVLLPLKFNVLRAEHSANYTCQATLPLLPLSTDLSLNATHFVDVYSEASYSVFQYLVFIFNVALLLFLQHLN